MNASNAVKKMMVVATVACAAFAASAFEYNVRQPSDVLRPAWAAKDTAPGVWTLNLTNALDRAKAEGKCTILLNTASWWCPYCETLEEYVLSSQAWRDFVDENGFYLAMLDFPYRNDVTKDQEWKSWYPELGKGWGFKCWLMYPDYLNDIGLTREQGLDAIMDLYETQKALALDGATQITISNWTQTAEFTYGKVGYPTFIVFGPDGKERGRTGFPWYRTADVTPSEAQEYVIQALDQIVCGECSLCEDPLAGTPPTSAAQQYTGWIAAEGEGTVGTVLFKTTKENSKGLVKVSGSVTFKGKTMSLPRVVVEDLDEYVAFAKKNVAVSVKFGEVGLGGVVTIDGVPYAIRGGGRNVFKAQDADAMRRAEDAFTGIWNIVLKPSDAVSPSEFSRGYGTLTVDVRKNGKAKIYGYLGDGKRVSTTSQVVMGEDGSACMPVYAGMYSKKAGGFGFAIWFKNGKIYSITDVAPWVVPGEDGFAAKYVPSFTMSSGYGAVESELELTLVGFDPEMTMKGMPLAIDPSEDIVEVVNTKWLGSDVTGFSASCVAKTGELKGSMKFRVTKGNSVKTIRGKFFGAVMGGSGYGTVVVPNVGSWAVRIAVCGGCSE